VQDFRYARIIRSNALIITDIRATKSLRQVIFEDFGTGMMEHLEHCGAVHWLNEMLKMVENTDTH